MATKVEHLKFFGINSSPFSLANDDSPFFLSQKHNEAIKSLGYGIEKGASWLLLTGEPGVGKTMLLKYLRKRKNDIIPIYFIPIIPLYPFEFKKFLHEIFNVNSWLALQAKLRQYEQCLIILDEAHLLQNNSLELLKILFEPFEGKITSIISGIPELTNALNTPRLASLAQRIEVHIDLMPLSKEETEKYIMFKLKTAGGDRNIRFKKKSFHLIYRFSKGVPREINLLMDRIFLVAYSEKTREISPKIVRKAIETLNSPSWTGLLSRILTRNRLSSIKIEKLEENIAFLKQSIEELSTEVYVSSLNEKETNDDAEEKINQFEKRLSNIELAIYSIQDQVNDINNNNSSNEIPELQQKVEQIDEEIQKINNTIKKLFADLQQQNQDNESYNLDELINQIQGEFNHQIKTEISQIRNISNQDLDSLKDEILKTLDEQIAKIEHNIYEKLISYFSLFLPIEEKNIDSTIPLTKQKIVKQEHKSIQQTIDQDSKDSAKQKSHIIVLERS